MQHIDPEEPMFHIYVDAKHVATMFAPRFDDMFWCSYRLEPVDERGDVIIHDGKIWENDWDADSYESNEYGTEDSVVEV